MSLSCSVHVAVPDFSAGAMENWGLIIYRETALLYDDTISSAAYRQRVAAVISHELAHQVLVRGREDGKRMIRMLEDGNSKRMIRMLEDGNMVR